MVGSAPRPHYSGDLRAKGVTAALLALTIVAGGCTESRAAAGHSCGALDRRFIETAGVNMTALGVLAEGIQTGAMSPGEVVEETEAAAKRIGHVVPRDPSLRKAQALITAMFEEYGHAVRLQSDGKPDAGDRMYRAYGLANFARDVLQQAQPDLAEQGCDVASLL
ncbi:MAG TPA: hypothetical protein VHK22_02355 [Gaiellaceae bacterium]|jgi:hypothetical protein|nr:hypothetical protein [Gaiellaceae bacterium]